MKHAEAHASLIVINRSWFTRNYARNLEEVLYSVDVQRNEQLNLRYAVIHKQHTHIRQNMTLNFEVKNAKNTFELSLNDIQFVVIIIIIPVRIEH